MPTNEVKKDRRKNKKQRKKAIDSITSLSFKADSSLPFFKKCSRSNVGRIKELKKIIAKAKVQSKRTRMVRERANALGLKVPRKVRLSKSQVKSLNS